MYADLMPDAAIDAFKASRGWRRRFIKRCKLTVRRRTNKKRVPIEVMRPKVQEWHTNVARMVASKPDTERPLDPVYGRFRPQNRLNVDQARAAPAHALPAACSA